MKIQFNTDHNISGLDAKNAFFSELIAEALKRFSDKITRIEAHLSDVNSHKNGPNDKRCMLEARIEGLQPIAVTNQADTLEKAVTGATEKLLASIDKIIGRLSNH